MGRIRVPKSGQIHPNGQAAPAASANTTGLVLPKTKTEVSGSGNSGQKIEPLEEEKSWWDSAVSAVASMDTHEALDTVGLIPGLGIAADLSNAALYAYEGDYVNASVSAAAASPIGGQAVTAAKYAKKAASTAMGTGGKKAVKNEVKEEAASKAAKGEPKASSGSGGNGGPPDKPPKKTDEPEPEEPKKGDGKDGGYVEGSGKGSGGKRSKQEVEQRTKELEKEGHAPQRHGEQVTDEQLVDRAVDGKDPVTGTKYDAYRTNKDGSPAFHRSGKNATKFRSNESLVESDSYIRKSPEFQEGLTNAKNGRFQVDVPAKDVLGDNYKDHLDGVTRLGGAKNPTGWKATDFEDASIRARYRLDSTGNVKLTTMYPEPKG